MDAQFAQFVLPAIGLLIGVGFGVVVLITNFCAMGAIADAVVFGDRRRLRSWLLAIGSAVMAAQGLRAAGLVDLSRSIYLPPTIDWCGALLGGAQFGVGMVLAGGCAAKNLVRAGSGDLRAAINLLVLAVTAHAALGGLFGPVRAGLARLTAIDLTPIGLRDQGLGPLLGWATGLPTETCTLVLAYLLATGLIIACLADRAFRRSWRHLLAGLGVGACVAAGWVATGLLYDEVSLQPTAPASLTFVRPTGDTLEWLMRFTAAPVPGFGVACAIGTLLGGFLAAWATGRLRLATYADVADTRRNLAGADLSDAEQ